MFIRKRKGGRFFGHGVSVSITSTVSLCPETVLFVPPRCSLYFPVHYTQSYVSVCQPCSIFLPHPIPRHHRLPLTIRQMSITLLVPSPCPVYVFRLTVCHRVLFWL